MQFLFLSLDACVWFLCINRILYFQPPTLFPPSREFQTSLFLLKNLNSFSVSSAGSTFFLNFLYLCSHQSFLEFNVDRSK